MLLLYRAVCVYHGYQNEAMSSVKALTQNNLSFSPPASLLLSVPSLLSHLFSVVSRVTEARGWLMAVGEMSGSWICPSNSLVADTLDLTLTDCECVFEAVCVNAFESWKERQRENQCCCVHASMCVCACVFLEKESYWKASFQSVRLAPLVD